MRGTVEHFLPDDNVELPAHVAEGGELCEGGGVEARHEGPLEGVAARRRDAPLLWFDLAALARESLGAHAPRAAALRCGRSETRPAVQTGTAMNATFCLDPVKRIAIGFPTA